MLCLRSYFESLQKRELFQLVCLIENTQRTATVYHVPWNASESIVNLDLPGVVVLDTSAVPDVFDLRARNNDAEPTRVLPGRAQNSVRVLMPDDRAAPWGFHDATIVDLAGATGRS